MPKTSVAKHKKRHGLHHRHNQRYLKTYLPYMPVIIALFISLLLGQWQPVGRKGTLAYATNTSISGLLQGTNAQRESNGQNDLQLNQQLNSAAQAKANDMVARNYWSHNTPDGQEPWVFVNNTGYTYIKAGENLAYGFTNSDDTITGWMNSPSHRENLLDSAFADVGFGFANGNNYNNAGPETVVVAMYGKPQTLGANAQQVPPSPQPITSSQPQISSHAPQPAPAPAAIIPPSDKNETAAIPPASPQLSHQPRPTNTDFPVITANNGLQPITRVQMLTGKRAPWTLFAVGTITGAAVIFLLIKHSLALRHLIHNSERTMLRQLHHPLFDSIMIGIIILGLTLSRAAGFIR